MTSFERWSVRLATLAVILTGFSLLWFQYGMESADPFAVVNHPLQIWALKGHVLAAPVFMLAIGFIAVRHIWRHIVRRVVPGRRSGLLTLGAVVPMIVSGYLIQVVVSETLLDLVIVMHIASSVVFTIGVTLHLALMWRYVRTLRVETSGAELRMNGVASNRRGTIDERDSAQRDLAEAGRPAR